MSFRPVTVLFLVLVHLAASCGDDGDSTEQSAETEGGAATEQSDESTGEPAEPGSAESAPEDAASDDAASEDGAAEEPEAPVDEPVEAPVMERDFSEVAAIIETFVAENELNGAGLAVVHAEEGVIYEEHWGVFDEDRISLIASSSKMVAAGVLMRLDDEGLLDVDAPVADVVEWGSGNPEITPAQLVSNSSGLVGLDPGYSNHICQFANIGRLQNCAESIFTMTEDDADTIPPDTEFRYGGAQWQIAGAVAEAASEKSWAELIDEIYVEPCGLESFGFSSPFIPLGVAFDHPQDWNGDLTQLPATENPNIEGGAYSTTGDYAELLLMHLRGGMCGDDQVLSPEAVDRLHADRIAEAYDGSAGDGTGYGMGWWIDRESGRITDPGAYGSVPWLDLEDGYGAYLVIEATSSIGGQLADQLFDPVEAAVLS